MKDYLEICLEKSVESNYMKKNNYSNADICMAHRYLYYVLCSPIISDREYDMLEKKALNEIKEDHPLANPGSDREESYSEKIKSLAKKMMNGELL